MEAFSGRGWPCSDWERRQPETNVLGGDQQNSGLHDYHWAGPQWQKSAVFVSDPEIITEIPVT
jgi:hypothetical protein